MTKTTTHPTFELPADTGRDIDWTQLRRQIGVNLLAISGGRWAPVGDSSVILPCGAGFDVLVTLEADDTYTVRRLFHRGGKLFLHGERSNVYCDEISEVAYYCSCFRSYDADEWPHKV
jgi:hypothetical protein